MTTESFNRAAAREARTWTPFEYSFPFNAAQTVERAIVFGLYANAYLNGRKYLAEIESEDLANLLADYNSKIAALTNQEQITVAEIVSRRYLSTIDKQIHDAKMTTKREGIEADDALWDAKIAALSVDNAALATMAAKVTSETEKTEARISELQSYIAIEGMNLSLADVEVVEKEIQSSRMDIQKLDVANEILKIQIGTVEKAQELIDIDVRIAKTKIDIAETDRAINKISLLGSELEIEQAKTAIAGAELDTAASRAVLAAAKTHEVQDEIDHITTQTTQAGTAYDNKTAAMDTRQAGKLDALSMGHAEKDLAMENRLATADLEVTVADADQALQPDIDAVKVGLMSTRASNDWTRAYAAVEAAKTIAGANIATQLTHMISKAP